MISSQEFKWLSTPFTEEEAKAVKKAFERVSLRKPQFMEDEWKLSKEKRRTMESNKRRFQKKNNCTMP